MNTAKHGEINVTPLIDVLLVLLIIFMVILPHHSTGLKAEAPDAQPSDTKAPVRNDVIVEVRGDRTVQINSEPVAWEDLASKLQEAVARRPGGAVFVGGESELAFEDITRVLDIARGVGIVRIGLLPKAV